MRIRSFGRFRYLILTQGSINQKKPMRDLTLPRDLQNFFKKNYKVVKFLNKYEMFYILHEHGVQPALKNNPRRQKTLSFISLLSLVCETQKIKMSM